MPIRLRWSWQGAPLVLLLAAAVGCDEPEDPAITTGEWTAASRDSFYHLPEGGGFAPLRLVLALHDSATGKPVLDNPERLGMLADGRSAFNPYGLPVGVTVDTIGSGRVVGFNCALCHTAEFAYNGRRVRIDGGPGLFNTDTLGKSLASAAHNLKQPKELLGFIIRVLLQPGCTVGPLDGGPAPAAADAAGSPDDRLGAALADADTTPAERALLAELMEAVERGHAAGPDRGAASPLDSLQAPSGLFTGLSPQHQADLAAVAGVDIGAVGRCTGGLDRMVEFFIRKLLAPRAGPHANTPPGVGRVEVTGAARNLFFPQSPIPTTAPLSYPYLWVFKYEEWIHADGNTNSIMERNIAQAFASGADTATGDPVHMYRMEELASRLNAPAWPNIFPAVRTAAADSGRALYGQYCAGCHLERPARENKDWCFTLDSIGTDPNRAVNSLIPLNGATLTSAIAPLLHDIRNVLYDRVGASPALRDSMNGMPDSVIAWRTTGMYRARPIAGIWATAPYLHNGSVPTLYDLLLPAGQRPPTFPLGHRDYDPVKLGYTTNVPNAGWTYSTAGSGNSNSGHEYGTQLAEPQRMQLLEYLKIHGTGADSVPAGEAGRQLPPGGVDCPNTP